MSSLAIILSKEELFGLIDFKDLVHLGGEGLVLHNSSHTHMYTRICSYTYTHMYVYIFTHIYIQGLTDNERNKYSRTKRKPYKH